MRKRLTAAKKEADRKKSAELTDPNQLGREDRVNPPVEKYETHKFVENHPLPDLKHDWKKDKRNEVGLPAPMKEAAVRKARLARERLEKETHKKAEACFKIAEILLPEGEVEIQESQAVDLMDLPTDAIVNTLRRKYELLENLEASKKEADKKETDKKETDKKEAFGEEAEEAEEEEKIEVEAEEVPEAPVEEDEIELSATSENDILDEIFRTKETSVKEPKKGAKKLGNVKKASIDNNLSGLWKSDPDVSEAFGI